LTKSRAKRGTFCLKSDFRSCTSFLVSDIVRSKFKSLSPEELFLAKAANGYKTEFLGQT